MAYSSRNLGLLGEAVVDGQAYREYVYKDSLSTLAQITTVGYFYNAGRDAANPNAEFLITNQDKITIIGSNGIQETRVTDDSVGTVG